MTQSEFETLKNKLAAMPSQALAAFIAELAVTSNRVREAVEIFSERNNPSKLTSALRKQLQAVEGNDHFYHYREAQTLVRRLDDWLDRIEQDLVPQNPEEAIDLLGLFFKADAAIYEHVDDSDGCVGMCYHRAAEIMAVASTQAGRPPIAGRWLQDLVQSNNYGVRDHLFDLAASFLVEDEIRDLIDIWQTKMRGETSGAEFDYQRQSLRVRCAQLARAIPDPELFAEIQLQGQDANASPLLALDIAELFLDTDCPERARDFLPESTNGHWDGRVNELKIRIHEALGENQAAQEVRWQNFCQHPSDRSAKEYLRFLPKAEQKEALSQMRAVVDKGDYNWRTKASYYLESKDHRAAAEIVESNYEEVRRSDYYTQSEMAGLLADSNPLAASLLLRGATEQTVAQSKSKYYNYAVRYIQKLETLAGLIENWDNLPNHQDWWSGFMEQHRRKPALVSKLKKAGVDIV